jgi:hypothetical protein
VVTFSQTAIAGTSHPHSATEGTSQSRAFDLRSVFPTGSSNPNEAGFSHYTLQEVRAQEILEARMARKRSSDAPESSRRVKPFGRGPDPIRCRAGHSEPDLADFIEDHLQGPRAAGFPENGTIESDLGPDGEHAVDKSLRMFMAGRFKDDNTALFLKSDFELAGDYAYALQKVHKFFTNTNFSLKSLLRL